MLSLIAAFKPRTAPVVGPLYAVFEGLALGAISALYNAQFRGLPMLAAALTFGVALVVAGLYTTRVLQATPRFTTGLMIAGCGIGVAYLLTIVLGLFGIDVPFITGNGPIAIGINVFTAGVAALFLILDFERVKEGVASGAPKWSEWATALGLCVTLVWLYLELLRLVSRIASFGRE